MGTRITTVNGNRAIEIDGEPFLPVMFRSFRPTPANVALFHRAGIRLFQLLCSGRNSTLGLPYSNYGEIWKGDHRYDFSALDRQMAMFQRHAPDGRFLLMVQLDMPQWWMDRHPGVADSFSAFGDALFCREWIEDAKDYLAAFIGYAEQRYGDRVFGYSCAAGLSTEWFDNPDSWKRPVSAAKLEAYRRWSGDPHAAAPDEQALIGTGDLAFREPASAERRYLDFCADSVAGTVLEFAAAAQSVLRHSKVFGLFFGYTDMPSGSWDWQNRTATNGYEAVWRSPDIDMVFSPAAYRECRRLDGASSYQCMVDSIALQGKLYLHEIDHRTHLADYPLDNFRCLDDAYRTAFESIMVLRRELCAALVKDAALWWFDFMGGYYASPEMEAEIARHARILAELHREPHGSRSEIAVFVDPRSFLLVREQLGLPNDHVRFNRDALNACGAPCDFFNLRDITRIDPGRYRMCVFLNAFDIPDEVRCWIRERLAGVLKVWVHAPDHASGGSLDASGMRLRHREPGRAEAIRYGDLSFGFGKAVTPMFEVVDAEATALGHYGDGGVAVARKGDNAYIAAGNAPYQLWRDLARSAGVHIYCENGGALYVDRRFIARQTVHETACEIRLPFDAEFEELFDGGRFRSRNRILRYEAEAGSTKLFRIVDARAEEQHA